MIAEKGLYVDPTIATGYLRELRNPGWMSSHHPDMPVDPDRCYEILRDMRERGVKFVTGLDSGMNYVRFDDYAYVPQLMAEEIGMSPMEALVAATRTSAECLGVLDDTGTLEVGKLADVVVVNGDPLADIRALHSVDAILKHGEVVKRDGVLLA